MVSRYDKDRSSFDGSGGLRKHNTSQKASFHKHSRFITVDSNLSLTNKVGIENGVTFNNLPTTSVG